MTFAIHEPVSELPPVEFSSGKREQWDLVYKAAKRAQGLWVPVKFEDRYDAKRLAEVARRSTGRQYDAEIRGRTVYVRYVAQARGFHQRIVRDNGRPAA